MENENVVNMLHVKGYIDNKFFEKNLLKKEYTHNLFLYLCNAMDLEYVSWTPRAGSHPKCVIEMDLSNIENYNDLRRLSYKLSRFIKGLIEIEDKYNFENSQLGEGREDNTKKVKLSIEYREKKRAKLFWLVDSFDDVNDQIKIINGIINYLDNLVRNNPEKLVFRHFENKWIKELMILKNSLKALSSVKQDSQDLEKEKPLPFKIALLSEMGFLETPKFKKLTQDRQAKLLKILIGGSERQVKGNIRVLDPNSKDDRLRYTSNSYLEEVKTYLNNL